MRFLKSFIVLLTLVSLAFSQGAPATYSNVAADVDFFLTCVDGVGDTLKTKSDSVTLCSDQVFPRGYEYILDRAAVVASGDSVGARLRIESVVSGIVVQVDTFLVEAGEQIILPVNKTLIGNRFNLKLLNISTLAAANTVLGKIVIWKRRAQSQSFSDDSRYRGYNNQ